MSAEDTEEIGEPDVPGRSAAFDAAVRLALEEADDDGGRSYFYRSDVETSDVVEAAEVDVSKRTALRACKDAAALGWLEDERQGWNPGPRAKKFAGVDE